jgi:hypothetical protein
MEREHWGPTLDELSRALPPDELDELRRVGASEPVEASLVVALELDDLVGGS